MCIIGCSPKLKIYDLVRSIRDEITDIDNISSKFYEIEQLKISFDKILKLIGNELNEKSENNLRRYIRQKIKEVNFFRDEYTYQGCIIYAKGEVCNKIEINELINNINFSVYHGRKDITNPDYKSLRPTNLSLITLSKKNNLDIRLLFVFAHNKYIKSHFYSRDDWIHIFSHSTYKKYIKYNKNINEEELWDDGIKVFLLNNTNQINDEFKKRLKTESKLAHPIAILCKNKKIFKEISEFTEDMKLSRWFVGCN